MGKVYVCVGPEEGKKDNSLPFVVENQYLLQCRHVFKKPWGKCQNKQLTIFASGDRNMIMGRGILLRVREAFIYLFFFLVANQYKLFYSLKCVHL